MDFPSWLREQGGPKALSAWCAKKGVTITRPTLTNILQGRRALSRPMAQVLGSLFPLIGAEVWLHWCAETTRTVHAKRAAMAAAGGQKRKAKAAVTAVEGTTHAQ